MVGQGEGQFKGRRVRPMGTKRGTKRQFEGPVVQRGRKAEAAGLGAQGQNEVQRCRMSCVRGQKRGKLKG